MSNINKINLKGRATRPLELKKTQNGTETVKVSFATSLNTGRKDENGKFIVLTDFYTFDLYGAQAKYAYEYLADKGRLCVTGTHHLHKYKKKDGNEGVESVIYFPEMEIIDFKNMKSNAQEAESADEDDLPTVELDNSDLPF